MPNRFLSRVGGVVCILFVLLFLTTSNRSPMKGTYYYLHELAKPNGAIDENALVMEPQITSQGLETGSPADDSKVVVMGKLQNENTSWVAEFLPDWENAIYTVDNTSAELHTKSNKGREANPYLLYIISNYHKLPATMAFIHSHRDGYPGGWHTDALDYDNVNSLSTLNIDFVQRNGYANLRCIWIPGCPDEIQPFRGPDTANRTTEWAFPEAWHYFFDTDVPEVVATPCCAQFAVSRDQVLKRPLKDYQLYYKWLIETTLDDDTSGRVFEYMWHIIFGQEPVYCPDLHQCYSDVYGRG